MVLSLYAGTGKRADLGKTVRELLSNPLIQGLLAGAAALAARAGWIAPDAGGYGMMLAAFGSPMAVASVAMSAEMGADDKLCGQVVVWTSLCSMASLFLITAILRALGLV